MNKDDLRKILSLESHINILKVEKIKNKKQRRNTKCVCDEQQEKNKVSRVHEIYK